MQKFKISALFFVLLVTVSATQGIFADTEYDLVFSTQEVHAVSSVDESETLVAGVPIWISQNAINQGSTPVTSFCTAVNVFDEDGNSVIINNEKCYGDSQTVDVTYAASHEIVIQNLGTYSIQMILDSRNQLSELDETNNETIQIIHVLDSTEKYPSPKHQVQNETAPENVICNMELELIFKIDGSPACVKHDSISKLIQRGWIMEQ